VEYWRRAGQRALERSANVEAITHLTRGVDVLASLPDDPERRQRELDLQTALGLALMATKGFGAPEVATAYARARELCQQLGETTRLFAVLRGLWEYYELRADAQTGLELAEELLRLAERAQDRTLLVIAHDVMQDTALWLGDYAATRSHMQQGLALYDAQQHRSLAFLHGGYDPAMACHCFGGHALWYLGYPDQALQHHREALSHARELAHPPTLVFAQSHAAVLHQFRGEADLTRERAEAAVALSQRQGFEFWRAHASIPLGWALARQGAADDGVAMILQGLAGYRATGAELERSLWVALLAEAYGRSGRPEQGLAALEEALAEVEKTGVRFHEAELHRLRGELLLGLPSFSEEEAVACFFRALEIARHRQAKSLELRAATSLSRLWARQGKPGDAHRLLADVFGWFTEGFETKDLREAQRLLDDLSRS
jgi:predicted ATPase